MKTSRLSGVEQVLVTVSHHTSFPTRSYSTCCCVQGTLHYQRHPDAPRRTEAWIQRVRISAMDYHCELAPPPPASAAQKNLLPPETTCLHHSLLLHRHGDVESGYPAIFSHGDMNSRLMEPMWEKTQVQTEAAGARVIAVDRSSSWVNGGAGRCAVFWHQCLC